MVLTCVFGAEACDGRAPASGLGWGVGEVFDEGRARENRADCLALNADALAVNDPDGSEAFASRFQKKLFDDGAHLARAYGVEVEHVRYLQAYGLGERVKGVNVVLARLRLRHTLFRHARRAAPRAEEFL